ncbi:putative orfan [Tupanvirus soda lake]|uniref:Orfan n=2 Tax=Tupanvirus TaxID=2094720 RepID=A0AC62AAM0_9VIRU|nr:putative orfan [Tupanvirus soda lake]QKU34695.1 putative orfan [Tupanvirus soda lake]
MTLFYTNTTYTNTTYIIKAITNLNYTETYNTKDATIIMASTYYDPAEGLPSAHITYYM